MWIHAGEPAYLKESLQVQAEDQTQEEVSAQTPAPTFPVFTEVVTCLMSCDFTCLLSSL